MDDVRILNRYRLIERLAAGGSAEVWRAHDEQLDREIAVKRLHPHLLPDARSRKRLAAEARAAAGLNHPVIVGVYDVDAEGDAPALVMELVDGESLRARIERDGPLRPAEAAAITADIADALYHAHQRGVIHRDVKPANVLLARDGRTRLVDFGIAHSLAESAERLTLTGTVIGTLSAMAPEQLAGGPITPRTDLYGLGVVLHEALTGRPPYSAASPIALAEAQRSGPPPMDGLDPALAHIVAACFAFEPENRPLHAGALARALRGWLAGDPSAALPMAVTAVHPALVDPDAATLPVAASPTGARPPRRRRSSVLPVALFVATALAVAAAVVVAIIGLGEPPAVGDPPASSLPSAAAASAAPGETPTPAVVTVPQPELRGWAADLAEKYAEACGRPLDPARIDGMKKKDAEAAIEPEMEACEESREDGD